MLKARITQVGNSVGIVLSKEVLAKLHSEKGDEVFLIEVPDGFKIVSYNPDFEKQMKTAEKLMRKYKNVFHMLAKS